MLVNSVPAGRIKFRVVISARRRYDGELLKPLAEQTRHFTMAFISYASEDRTKGLARVQMLRLLGINYFQDILDLEPGQRWEKELYRHIDECDLFLLFWVHGRERLAVGVEGSGVCAGSPERR